MKTTILTMLIIQNISKKKGKEKQLKNTLWLVFLTMISGVYSISINEIPNNEDYGKSQSGISDPIIGLFFEWKKLVENHIKNQDDESKVVSPCNNYAFKQESIVDKTRVSREMILILSPNPWTSTLSSGKITAKAAR